MGLKTFDGEDAALRYSRMERVKLLVVSLDNLHIFSRGTHRQKHLQQVKCAKARVRPAVADNRFPACFPSLSAKTTFVKVVIRQTGAAIEQCQ